MEKTQNSTFRQKFIKNFMVKTQPILQKLNKEHTEKNLSKEEIILLDYGQVIAEIESSFEFLHLLPKLITSHSSNYEKRGFSRSLQHRKHIESYFNEVYILKERVIKVLNLMAKELTESRFSKESEERITIIKLKERLIKSIESLINIRGKHVHDYSYSDSDLYHVELLDLAYRENETFKKDKEVLKADLNRFLKQDRSKWKNLIERNNEEMEKLISDIYKRIDELKIISKTTNELF